MKIFKLVLILFLLPITTLGASLYFSPASGTFSVGSTFDVSVFVNTNNENINAAEVNVKFDPKKLQIVSPTAGRSFIEVWVTQPVYSNTQGTMSFIGGIPSPGIKTSSGLVSTVTFRAIAPGETTINFLESSKVLRNDPDGTNILSSLSRGIYNLVIPPPEGPRVYSPTHPDTHKWYKDNNPTFCWEKEEGVTGFSYSFSQDPQGFPDNESKGDHNCISYSEVSDGIWYFHIKAVKGNIWGGTSHYSAQIDNTPPAVFSPTVESPKTTDNQPLVFFITTDSLSGISHYEIRCIDITPYQKEETIGFFREVVSPHRLPSLDPGQHLIAIRAYDLAGNYQEGTVKITILTKGMSLTSRGIYYQGFGFPWWLLILILIIIILLIANSFFRKEKTVINYKRQELKKIEKSRSFAKYTYLKKAIKEIKQKEIELELKAQDIEVQEKNALPERKKMIEKMRWQIDDQRRAVEKKRWELEDEKQKLKDQNQWLKDLQ